MRNVGVQVKENDHLERTEGFAVVLETPMDLCLCLFLSYAFKLIKQNTETQKNSIELGGLFLSVFPSS